MNHTPPDNGIPLLTEIIPVTPTPPSAGSQHPQQPAAFAPEPPGFNQNDIDQSGSDQRDFHHANANNANFDQQNSSQPGFHQPNFNQPGFNQHFAPNFTPSFNPAFSPDFNLNLPPDLAPQSSYAPPAYAHTEQPAPSLQPQQLEQMRLEIQESVMQTVLGHIDSVLHEHLQDQLAIVLDNLADMLKVRVKASMEQALVASVAQAVAEEMAKFDNSKK
ncbi:hypothetical protein [Herbaspirillum autotrophicum]|uniref:hypothetical protein n=1 Tax=Herbaspirillum autotrophicum TaxID=180195 RepID=UPI00067E1990|nr:hypothetical protein [Herbaspirillum autotrophicum]